MRYKIIITGGGGVTGRAVARSIRMSKIFKRSELVACDIFHNNFSIFEGLFDKYIKIPHVDSEKYEIAFLETLKEEKPDAVLIMTEKESIFWSNQQHKIPSSISPFKFSEIAIDKAKLYNKLKDTNLVPHFCIFNKNNNNLQAILKKNFKNQSVWMRCFDEGSTSGKGSFLANNFSQAEAWITLNESIEKYLISEVLPGRNFACNLLYASGKLLQAAVYERIEYFMSHIAPSGITGNISVGRLVNDEDVISNSKRAIETIENLTASEANGLYTVDLKGDINSNPMITEINLRHTAATSAFAQAGWNMTEFQLLDILGRTNEIPTEKPYFSKNNLFLRDIDGLPVFLKDFNSQIDKVLIDKTNEI